MPNEPQRPIEELLTTYAKQRRDQVGAPFELHPATRKLLLDEVAHTHPRRPEASASKFAWLKVLWPRIALAGSVVVALGLAVVLFLQFQPHSRQPKLELAKQDKLPSGDVAGHNETPRPDRTPDRIRERQPARFASAPTAPPLTTEAYTKPAAVPAPTERYARRTETESDALRSATLGERAEANTLTLGKSSATQLAYTDKAKAASPSKPSAPQDKLALARSQAQPEAPVRMARRYGMATTPPPGGVAGGSGGGGGGAGQLAPPAPGVVAAQLNDLAVQPSLGRQVDTAGQTFVADAKPATESSRATGGEARLGALPEQGAPTKTGVAAHAAATPQPSAAAPALVVTTPDARALRDGSQMSNLYGHFVTQGEQLNQRFTQAARYRRNFNSPARPEVLNSFQFEQNGPRIRIVDADGSIYEGAIEQPAGQSNLRADTLQAAKPTVAENNQLPGENHNAAVAGTRAAGAPALQNFLFTASGTNRSLNQAVVFHGNYIADTNTVQLGTSNSQARVQQSSAAPNAATRPNQLQLPNALVQGRAVIGGSNRLEINAVPAEQ
jgi:hypothetical protein